MERSTHDIRKGIKMPNMRYILAVLIALVIIGGTTVASAFSLPGDPLYGVKRFKERVQLAMALTDRSRAEIQTQYAHERLEELAKLKLENEPEYSAEVRTQAKTETKQSIDDALETLNRTEDQLRNAGDTVGADVIREKITELQSESDELELEDGSSDGSIDSSDDRVNQSRDGSPEDDLFED